LENQNPDKLNPDKPVPDKQNADQRVQLVQLYIQADRIQDANAELKGILTDFPNLKELHDTVRSLTQVGSQRLLREVEQREKAGQPGLALNMLSNFPADGVAGETLLKVREMIKKYDDVKAQAELNNKRLQMIAGEIKDEKRQAAVARICDEISTEINIHNYDRLADFARLFDDQDLSPEQKLALAISGWLLGNGQGIENLGLSLSLVEVRNLTKQYLLQKRKVDREALLKAIKSEEGAVPAYLAKILATMKPPQDSMHDAGEALAKRENNAETPVGLRKHIVTTELQEAPEIPYYVQLPPEYDSHRKYPVIVTLNGAGTSPLHQIEWWAGTYNAEAQMRYGQAARHGYIVIAPDWTREHQRKYEYSAREHAAILHSLRDAFRRYSIDTDRVFLSGHSMGGDAAWDIGLAHPDLFAGVIPIVAEADKYISHYAKNGQLVPFYFVCGQMDGAKREQNAPEWDRYLIRPGYDVMVVEYLGRGHEHFYEEVQNIFDWMNRHQRDFSMARQKEKDFTAMTMRPWDTFFFWVEIDKLPPTASILPVSFGKVDKARAIETTGKILANNGLSVSTGAGKATVYFSPDIIDLNNSEKPPFITIRTKRFNQVVPSLEVMLEDARTRADRQHPFWGKIEY
jgi:predicted esterase